MTRIYLNPKVPGNGIQTVTAQLRYQMAGQRDSAKAGIPHSLPGKSAADFLVEDAQIKWSVVGHQNAVAGKVEPVVGNISKDRSATYHLIRDSGEACDKAGD